MRCPTCGAVAPFHQENCDVLELRNDAIILFERLLASREFILYVGDGKYRDEVLEWVGRARRVVPQVAADA